MNFRKLAFLASGRGSSMRAIIEACDKGIINAEPILLISNNHNSEAVVYAKERGIESKVALTDSIDCGDSAICEILDELKPDLVILSGYIKKIGTKTLSCYNNKILNIHPSLLPNFGGRGMYGNKVHKAVIAKGCKETGITIHWINSEYDEGPILSQCIIPIALNEVITTLQQKFQDIEPKFFVETLRRLQRGEPQIVKEIFNVL
jgi:phosphoribosylglycinamide formyltransferase 1